ncbi:MAG: hypothetical protein OSA81_10535 [Longimicrobiales bacterium]|nr:hypothetical protein [Longimicrobiales bacterium]
MKKIVTTSRAKAACKWRARVSFVISVSIFVNDAFIRSVTAVDAGIVMSVCLMSSVAEWTGDPMDQVVAFISGAGLIT